MFLSFIPAWLACCLLYSASPKQKILKEALPTKISWLTAFILFGLMVFILFEYLPAVSALITGLSLICCFLPLITLISAYKKQYIYLATTVVFLIALIPPFIYWLTLNSGGNT